MNVIAFVISLALFVGGIWVMSAAFAMPGLELVVFFGGILLSTLGVFIPVHVLKRVNS